MFKLLFIKFIKKNINPPGSHTLAKECNKTFVNVNSSGTAVATIKRLLYSYSQFCTAMTLFKEKLPI